jgi:NCS1 family nucleobase:cation symporter-1
MVTDYFLIRGTVLDVNSLYHSDGAYHYTKGVNLRAMAALALGVVIALIGLFVPTLHFLYDYAWFVGFFLAALSYLVMMRMAAPAGMVQKAEEVA